MPDVAPADLRNVDPTPESIGVYPEVTVVVTILTRADLISTALQSIQLHGPLHQELIRRGYKVCFMVSPKAVAAARSAPVEFVDTVVAFDLEVIVGAAAVVVVVVNDLGPVRELVEVANSVECRPLRRRKTYRTSRTSTPVAGATLIALWPSPSGRARTTSVRSQKKTDRGGREQSSRDYLVL